MTKRHCSACGKCWYVERYRVHDALWPQGHTRLHMRCLEKIIKRDLVIGDLTDYKPNRLWRPQLGEIVVCLDRQKSRAMYDHGRLVRTCPDGNKWFVLLVDGKVHCTWGLMQRVRSPETRPSIHADRRAAIMEAVLPPFFGTEDLEAAAQFSWSALHDDDFDYHGNLRAQAVEHQRMAWAASALRTKHVLAFLNNPLTLMEVSLVDESSSSGHGPGARGDRAASPASGT